jgi:hypothetical protein
MTGLLVLLMCASCGGGKQQTQTERPSSTAKLVIVAPTANQVVHGKTFTVGLKLTGGRIVNEVSQDLTPDEGHVHVSIDGRIQSMTFGLEDELKTPKKGSHLLQAEFVAKDHSPFDPRVLTSVTFAVG